jgi:glutaredoxin-like YruB-family protein
MTNKTVTVYSTPTCPYCKRAKDYLTQKGIVFTDYNVAEDREKAKEMIEKSKQMGVPVIVVGDDIILGFNQAKLDSLLK